MAAVWLKDYLLNLDEIDRQHQRFFAICEELSGLVAQPGKERAEVQAMFRLLLKLRSYGYRHFGVEEALMVEKGYPDFIGHLDLHDAYIAGMREHKNSFIVLYKAFLAGDKGETDINAFFEQVVDFITNWFAEHIMNHDAKYAEHIRSTDS